MTVKLGTRNRLSSGPWSGVVTTVDPFDGGPDKLVDARNVYNPAPGEKAATYARPGFVLLNNGDPVYTSATPFKGQGCYAHYDVEGNVTNLVAMGGHLFRDDPATGILTDVTPVGVVIDGNISTRVGFGSLGGVLAVTDGVHRPWVASNLSSTPITGTYIDFDGAGTAWTAFGPPTVFGGAGFWTLASYNGSAVRIDIAWTEPNTWTTGYQQADFDNRWTLEQTGTTPIGAIEGTNVALYYWRAQSIGSISGVVGIDLATTATHDSISTNVGCQAPQTIAQFGEYIFFCDVVGRPWRFLIGGSAPEPVWHQLRGIVDVASTGYPDITAVVSCAAFDPTLILYCVAIWSPSPANVASPTEFYAFDAGTGTYMGRWSIGPSTTGTSVDALGTLVDPQGRLVLVVLGSAVAGGTTGYAWGMSDLIGVPDALVLEDLTTTLTDESTPSIGITAEGQSAVFLDNGAVPAISVSTDRLGYSEDIVWLYDQLTALTGTDAPLTITVTTPNEANVAEGTPTPNSSADGVYRTQMGLDLQGRGASVTVSPTTADAQWSIDRVTLVGIPNPAAQDDA